MKSKNQQNMIILINEATRIDNFFLVKISFKNNQIPKDILLSSTASGKAELVKFIDEKVMFFITFSVCGYIFIEALHTNLRFNREYIFSFDILNPNLLTMSVGRSMT